MDEEPEALVRRIAQQMLQRLPANVEVADLIQVGLMGSIEARDRFDPSQGVQFETFATTRIRGAMLDYLRSQDHLPRSVRHEQRRIAAAERAAEHRYGRPARESEVALEMGIFLADYQARRARCYDAQLVHLEDLAIEGGEIDHFIDRRVQDRDDTPLRRLEDRRLRDAVTACIGRLPEPQRKAMTMYYDEGATFGAIGRELGVTESRAWQIHAKALATLKQRLREY